MLNFITSTVRRLVEGATLRPIRSLAAYYRLIRWRRDIQRVLRQRSRE